jgi:hypothetical protein
MRPSIKALSNKCRQTSVVKLNTYLIQRVSQATLPALRT